MITKSELQAANEELKAEARATLGEPPTAEELRAYWRGELPPGETARMREQLVCHPELARALAVEFPAEDEADVLPVRELDRRWEEMRTRIGIAAPAEAPGRVVHFWRTAFAVAAVLACVFGALLVKTQTERASLERDLASPRGVSMDAVVLSPDTRRGPAEQATPIRFGPSDESLLLAVPALNAPVSAAYRVEIAEAASSRVVWSSNVRRREDDSFQVLLPRGALPAGIYRLSVIGVDGARTTPVGIYTFRLF